MHRREETVGRKPDAQIGRDATRKGKSCQAYCGIAVIDLIEAVEFALVAHILAASTLCVPRSLLSSCHEFFSKPNPSLQKAGLLGARL
jgi:hypothetical protein